MYLWFDGSGKMVGKSRTDIGLDFGFETTKIQVSNFEEGKVAKLVDEKVVKDAYNKAIWERDNQEELMREDGFF